MSALKGTNGHHSDHRDQSELMAEIYSKSPARAIAKVLLVNKHIKVMKDGLYL